MPLMKSASKKAFKENMESEMDAGKPQDQSLAIAYDVQRRNKKSYAEGGMVEMPDHEEHYSSIADAILAKKRDARAEPTEEGHAADEEMQGDPGTFEDMNTDAMMKENYEDPDDGDMVSSIRKKLREKRGF